jgi:phosphohistidine phosphatase
MNIYLLRHGTAEDREVGKPDASRALTKEGRRELRAVLHLARMAGVKPGVILTSPLRRAVETARVASAELQCDKVLEIKELTPDTPPPQLWRAIRAHRSDRELVLAGHEPQLTRLAAFLLEAPLAIDLKKGALVKIAVQDSQGPPRGVLKWMLTPKLAGGK